MTAANIAFAPDFRKAYILTDSLASRPLLGRLKPVGHVEKIHAMPRSKMAASARGDWNCFLDSRGVLDRYASIDEARDRMQRDLCATLWGWTSMIVGILVLGLPWRWPLAWRGNISARNFELFLVGWSHRENRVIALRASSESWPPFRPEEFTDPLCAPGLPPSMQEGLQLPTIWWREFEFVEFLLRLVCLQRELCFTRRGAELIGGKVTLATVTRDGIELRTVGAWPDEIGRRIDPDAELETLR